MHDVKTMRFGIRSANANSALYWLRDLEGVLKTLWTFTLSPVKENYYLPPMVVDKA